MPVPAAPAVLCCLQRKDVRLYYGARSPDHMAYKERTADWEAAGVKVIPVFSEDGQGYVQDALAKASLLLACLFPCLLLVNILGCCLARKPVA